VCQSLKALGVVILARRDILALNQSLDILLGLLVFLNPVYDRLGDSGGHNHDAVIVANNQVARPNRNTAALDCAIGLVGPDIWDSDRSSPASGE